MYRDSRGLAVQQAEAENMWKSDTIYVIQTSALPENWFFYEYIFSSQVAVSFVYDYVSRTTLRQKTIFPKDLIDNVAHWNVYRMRHYDTDGAACPDTGRAMRLIRKGDRIYYDYLIFKYDACATFLEHLHRISA